VEPWFIPVAEPWRNGVVEKFNDHYQERFLDRIQMATESELISESLNFEQRHNGSYVREAYRFYMAPRMKSAMTSPG
jgi:hypothetical protein